MKFTAEIFAPFNNQKHSEKWSTVFLAQTNSTRQEYYASKFSNSTPIQYSTFDFNNANEDGSEIAKTYREDIAILREMKNLLDRQDDDNVDDFKGA